MSDMEYLEWELERYREAERHRQEEWMREWKRKKKEREQRLESSYRQAESWLDALGQQAFLCQREADQFGEEDDPDAFFSESAEACYRALELWSEVAPTYQKDVDKWQGEIERLQGEIEDIGKKIRADVGTRLLDERNTTGWRSVATSLIELDEDDYEEWLDW